MAAWSSGAAFGGHAAAAARASPEMSTCLPRRGPPRWMALSPMKKSQTRDTQRGPLSPHATPASPASGGIQSESGPSSVYSPTWDGGYDISRQGMWDTLGIQGPSCFLLPPLDVATTADLERTYAQAKNTYFSGQPVISDVMFDEIELRLRQRGSDFTKKYPRCSRRDMKIYGDLESDDAQMANLQTIWLFFFLIGGSFVVWDLVELGKLIDVTHTAGSAIRPPLFGALGFVLAQASFGKISALRDGAVVAVAGDCPNCGERVFSFLPGNEGNKVTRAGECHVCDRGVSFRADIQTSRESNWGRTATGRVYLATRKEDFFGNESAAPPAPRNDETSWPPKKNNP